MMNYNIGDITWSRATHDNKKYVVGTLAIDNGYYIFPKRIKTTELAAQLKIMRAIAKEVKRLNE